MRLILVLFVISTFIRMVNAEDWFSVAFMVFMAILFFFACIYEWLKPKPSERFYDLHEDIRSERDYDIPHSYREE